MQLIKVKHPTVSGETMLVEPATAQAQKLEAIKGEDPIETGANASTLYSGLDTRTGAAPNAEIRMDLYENPSARIPSDLEVLTPENNTAGMTKTAVQALIQEAIKEEDDLDALETDLPLNEETEGKVTKGRGAEQTPSPANPLATKKTGTAFRGTPKATENENSKQSM